MFSWPSPDTLPSTRYSYDLVDTQRGSPQGRIFPSDIYRAHQFAPSNSTIPPWYSEGQLTSATVEALGTERTIEAFRAHRDQYWTDDDLALMRKHGINTVRLNVGWWAFPTYPLPQTEMLLEDMCYGNLSFVSLTGP